MASISVLEWDENTRRHVAATLRMYWAFEYADEFFRRIWVEMNPRSDDLGRLRIVFIGDGADWIWRRAVEIGGGGPDRLDSPRGSVECIPLVVNLPLPLSNRWR